MPSAIITGATGILGREIVFAMGQNAQQWPTVHALSRSKKENYPSNVVHNHIDLQSSAHDMANDLQDVQAEYVFFAAYLQKDSEQENFDINVAMLDNFLRALDQTGAVKGVKRIILVTGAKQYAVHLGAPKNPMLESDPWVKREGRPPNFYYGQQDVLHKYCEGKQCDWVVTYPNDVIGFAKGNFMNLATSVGIYAAVNKELEKDLAFPGSETFYTMFDCFTYSRLHAQFCLWAALEPRCGNEAFNVVNGDAETWQNLWPRLAARYGRSVAADQFKQAGPDSSTTKLADLPPIADTAAELGLQGHPVTQQSKVEQRIDLIKWSQKLEVQQAWKKLADREGLEQDAFEKATWEFLGFVLGRNYNLVISMSKARKLGWTGYEDSWEALEEVFDDLEREQVLPQHVA